MKNRFKISFAVPVFVLPLLLLLLQLHRKGRSRTRTNNFPAAAASTRPDSCWMHYTNMHVCFLMCLLHFRIYYWVAEIYVRQRHNQTFICCCYGGAMWVGWSGRRRSLVMVDCVDEDDACYVMLHSGYLIWFPGHLPITAHVIYHHRSRLVGSGWLVDWPYAICSNPPCAGKWSLLKSDAGGWWLHKWIYIVVVVGLTEPNWTYSKINSIVLPVLSLILLF